MVRHFTVCLMMSLLESLLTRELIFVKQTANNRNDLRSLSTILFGDFFLLIRNHKASRNVYQKKHTTAGYRLIYCVRTLFLTYNIVNYR